MLSSKIVKDAKLKVYKGAPHGMCTTHKAQINADLRGRAHGRRRNMTTLRSRFTAVAKTALASS
jgi:hypothetical protein